MVQDLIRDSLDLFVVDDITGMPLGRPWVTICIDSFSRCILGIYIGFEPPSYLTVARCLKHAFMPKVDLQEIYPEIEHAWDAYGVMQTLVVDNGLEFHSHALETACFTLGIDLQFTPRKTPWWKGVVERFIGTMNRGIAHGNPGTTFANIFEKDDYDPAKHAVITFSTLKLALHKWVADVYHQRPHRSLDNVSPAVMWESSIRPEEINLPEDPARMDAILGRCHKRILTHKGIEFEGLRYNSPELVALRRRLGDKLEIELRVDEGDLGYIYALSPDHAEHFKVTCLNQEYASGMSLWQHNVCKRYAATHLKISADSNSWRHAKEDIAEIFQREVLSNRLRKSKTASRAVRFKLAGLSENTQVETNANPEVSAAISTPASRPDQHFTVVSPSSSRIIRPKFDVLIENRTASDLC